MAIPGQLRGWWFSPGLLCFRVQGSKCPTRINIAVSRKNELADQTENTQAKAKLLEMAEHWLQLAMETARASTLTHVRGRIGCRRFSHVAAFCNRRERT
jgi:hypothetical protein